MKILIAAFLMSLSSVHAFNTEDALHPVAHAAGSYVVTHFTEVVCKRVSDRSKLSCSLIGAGVAMTAGVLIELTQKENFRNHTRGLLEDAFGVGLAIGIINVDF